MVTKRREEITPESHNETAFTIGTKRSSVREDRIAWPDWRDDRCAEGGGDITWWK